MPQYKVLERSLIGNEIYEEGAVVDYDGYPSGNLEPLCKEGEAKAAELVELNKARIKQMQLDNPDSPIVDMEGFAKALAKELRESAAEQATTNAAILEALSRIAPAHAKTAAK